MARKTNKIQTSTRVTRVWWVMALLPPGICPLFVCLFVFFDEYGVAVERLLR